MISGTMCDPSIQIRHNIRPGDLGSVIHLHGLLYAEEYGFDLSFETDVASAITEFFRTKSGRERTWIVEQGEEMVGCITIVQHDDSEAQLRWFLLHPTYRGLGIGKKLIHEAIAFSKSCGYLSIFLWTADFLLEAANLYRSVGFTITDATAHTRWGRQLTEQRYDLRLL
ncbi:MAG: GNAT family N-acetyltransferase [Bacteroidetes bacterium]|nr:GNAT family N-acetyltransferase [Bacteroidota bacterium]